MLTLHYAKGSSALAPHILLLEVGAAHDLAPLSIPEGGTRTPEFLSVNPKGRVPALAAPDGVLTENPAVLEWIAEAHPDAGLVPDAPWARARARSLAAYLCATAHVAFAHKARGARWTDDAAAQAALKLKVAANIADCAAHVEAHEIARPWALGDAYSWVDPYLLLLSRWMDGAGVAVSDYPKIAAHRAAMLERPAVRGAMEAQGL